MASPIHVSVGYGAVAACMSCDRDLALFRRFGIMNSRNLLYLQSELMSLEARLQELDSSANEISKGNDVWSIPRSWYYLEKAGGEHLEVVLKIREKLNTYNQALASHAWLLSLNKPAPRPISNLAEYLRENRREMSQSDAEFIAEKYRSDMVALSHEEKELMSRFLERHFYWIFGHKQSGLSNENGLMAVYSNGKIRNAVRLLAVIGSSLLPILSIVVLYTIPSQGAIAFSFLCSATLATLSNARNVEIIAATAAYAAIQVVFVSGNISPDPTLSK